MPRMQARLRSLHRITNRINELLFNQEFIDFIIRSRYRLGIDVRILQEIASASIREARLSIDVQRLQETQEILQKYAPSIREEYKEHFNQEFIDTNENMYARIGAMAQYLLEKRFISQFSAKALERLRLYPDSGKFWKVVGNAYKLDWPDTYSLVPYNCIVGGLCFDVTGYAQKYERSEFCKATKQFLKLTEDGWKIRKSVLNNLPEGDLDEYAFFRHYVDWSMIESNLIYFDKPISEGIGIEFETVDAWRKYISTQINENSVYLNTLIFPNSL